MSFTLICYSPSWLEIGSENGHHFAFDIVSSAGRRAVVLRAAQWRDNQPGDVPFIIEHAHRFAAVCAVDCGLM